MILKELRRTDAYPSNWNDFNISPLTYNGEVIEVTWPQVTDIKTLRYTNFRYYFTSNFWEFKTDRMNDLALARLHT